MDLDKRYKQTLERNNKITEAGYVLHHTWECEFTAQFPKEIKEFRSHGHPFLNDTVLIPRDAFYGGRTGHMMKYYKVKPGEKIFYIDICSLYPSISKYGEFYTGHPDVYVGDECFKLVGCDIDISKVKGIMKVLILPPQNLIHPVLPFRMYYRLLFALCRSCVQDHYESKHPMHNHSDSEENLYLVNCPHDVADRAFLGTWMSAELQKAVSRGYKILRIHEIWHYSSSTQYNPETGEGGLFTGYINELFKIKTQASGFPDHVKDANYRTAYIAEIEQAEGIKLDPEKMVYNPGLRAVSKLAINCLWGRFGMRNNLPTTQLIRDRESLLAIVSDERFEVTNILPIDDDSLYVSYIQSAHCVDVLPTTNVVIAAQTTCLARLTLLDYLEKFGSRVIYCDTDSVFYIDTGDPDEFSPTLGSCLGQMTSELSDFGPNGYIDEFVAAADKFYAYQVVDSQGQKHKHCKVKGITLNSSTCAKLNFESIRDLVFNESPIDIKYDPIVRTPDHQVLTVKNRIKRCKPIHNKRHYCGNSFSVPFGYKKPEVTP